MCQSVFALTIHKFIGDINNFSRLLWRWSPSNWSTSWCHVTMADGERGAGWSLIREKAEKLRHSGAPLPMIPLLSFRVHVVRCIFNRKICDHWINLEKKLIFYITLN
ncbi:hypothetical protein QQF64_026374 [Cirrhinus molitorella]|uniref:Uncharacterized protein n=1 Tax=Cirrhinus molitorella TaxID=172907 RepID=A0ABR3N9G1_9TELE